MNAFSSEYSSFRKMSSPQQPRKSWQVNSCFVSGIKKDLYGNDGKG